MTSSSPAALIQTLTMLGVPLLYLAMHIFILGACIFGVTQPSLRREFTWFTLAAVLNCIASVITLIPQLIRLASSDTSSAAIRSMSTFYSIASGIHVLSLLFMVVGFILLALRARSLPVMRS